jgi:hypothetical protein
MYRIVREENHLADTVRFIIERKKSFLWASSWTRDLGLSIPQRGPVGAPTYDGAVWKMNKIKLNDGNMIRTAVILKKYHAR